MLKIGITGNIASGKSVAENILIKKGFKVFDTDKIAHGILENSVEVVKAFSGFDILTDGVIDRKKLGNIVFADKKMLQKLENIIHPLVKKELEEIFQRQDSIVFVSVPQLFEAGFDKLFDKIILITADEKVRLKRLMERNSLPLKEADMRIKSQIPQEEKIAHSDFVINNESSINEMENALDRIIKKLV